MTRDTYLRILFIPLPGVLLPVISGLVSYRDYTLLQLVGVYGFFILSSFIIWAGCNWIHIRLRQLFSASTTPLIKILSVCSFCIVYAACISSFTFLAWQKISGEVLFRDKALQFAALYTIVVIVFTLISEILFLSKERERDLKLVTDMGRELSQAELLALTNQMDPHFVFNSLNAMNHLILNNPMQAHLFNNNLAQVFKYFLLNKKRELIPLSDEIAFINNYFFLLEIRYENKLRLNLALGSNQHAILIPPCALQILIENAIKHNEFSMEQPLDIKIVMNGHYLKVINNLKPKPYSVNSTNIGLKNLSSRFKLICHKDILVEKNANSFTVKLPIIKKM
jgi:sensor histidine kinase YesM